MNSYVRGGVPAAVQSLAGSTPSRLDGVLRISNGLLLLTARGVDPLSRRALTGVRLGHQSLSTLAKNERSDVTRLNVDALAV